MQCAAVRTYRLFIKLPPHLNSPPSYCKRAKKGNSPCFAMLPDKRLFVFVGFPHSFTPPSGIQVPSFLGFCDKTKVVFCYKTYSTSLMEILVCFPVLPKRIHKNKFQLKILDLSKNSGGAT